MKQPTLSNNIQHLIWIQTSFLGDIVLTTGAIRLARQKFPHARQWMVTTQGGCIALRGHRDIDGLIRFNKKDQSFWSAAREVRSKLVEHIGPQPTGAVTLQVHRSFRSSLLARMVGFPTVTYDETSLGFLAAQRVPRVALLHEASRIALLLEPLGVAREDILGVRPHLEPLPLNPDGFFWEKDLLKSTGPLVGVAPGSVWGTKRWPVEGFAHVVGRILNETPAGVVIIGSQDEAVIARDLESRIPEPLKKRFWNLAGKTSLDDLCRLYPRLTMLLSNDSSPIHYASAFNIPTVALFGPTIPQMGFGPLAQNSVSLGVPQLSCRPCSDHGPQVCPQGHFKCMTTLPPDAVFAACRERIAAATP